MFAIGAFLAFTLSQAGMVGHWRKTGGRGAKHKMILNGLGAVATGITMVIVLVAKFAAGAWMSVLLIAGLMSLMLWVRRHYDDVSLEVAISSPLQVTGLTPPLVVVPINQWGKVAQRALQFALTLSTDVRVLHVATEEETNELQQQWGPMIEEPVKRAGAKPPVLVTLPSPYRLVVRPILDYVANAERENPNRQVAIIIPELVEKHWYHYPLHNQRAELLKALLLLNGSPRIVLINVPWYIKA